MLYKGLYLNFYIKILQRGKATVFMTMNNEKQKVDVRISDIIVSIAPAAIRTVIGITSSLGTLQVNEQLDDKNLSIILLTLFSFWFSFLR